MPVKRAQALICGNVDKAINEQGPMLACDV